MAENYKVRELRDSDIEQMWRLCTTLARTFPDVRDMGLEEFTVLWKHRWGRNKVSSEEMPLGWCLDCQNEGIVSFLGNIGLEWWINGEEKLGWGITSWISDPRFGVASTRLFMDVLNRTDVPIILECTANSVTAKVCKYCGLKETTEDISPNVFFWIINAPKFFSAWSRNYLKRETTENNAGIKYKILDFLARSGMIWLVTYLYTVWQIFLIKPFSSGSVVAKYSITEVLNFGVEFEQLWVRNKGKVFSTAVRTPEILNWRHFQHPTSKGKTYVLQCTENRNLKGYITLKFLGWRESYCKNAVVTDIFYDFDDFEIAKSLLISAYKFAKEKGAIRFQVHGFHKIVMEWLTTQNPLITEVPRCTYWYKHNVAKDKYKGKSLWYSSAIDGDLNL